MRNPLRETQPHQLIAFRYRCVRRGRTLRDNVLDRGQRQRRDTGPSCQDGIGVVEQSVQRVAGVA